MIADKGKPQPMLRSYWLKSIVVYTQANVKSFSWCLTIEFLLWSLAIAKCAEKIILNWIKFHINLGIRTKRHPTQSFSYTSIQSIACEIRVIGRIVRSNSFHCHFLGVSMSTNFRWIWYRMHCSALTDLVSLKETSFWTVLLINLTRWSSLTRVSIKRIYSKPINSTSASFN